MNLALLVLGLVVGVGFAAHGAQTLFGAFGGAGIAGTGGFFEQVGLRTGGLHALAAGASEFVGGLLIAVGPGTPFATAALIAMMTAAVLTVHGRNEFFITGNGFEYNLTLAAAVFAVGANRHRCGSGAVQRALDAIGTLCDLGLRAAALSDQWPSRAAVSLTLTLGFAARRR